MEPFASQDALDWGALTEWLDDKSTNKELNLGAVFLPDTSLADAVGYSSDPGRFRYGLFTDQGLPGIPVNLAGYPGVEPYPFDNCPDEGLGLTGCQQWFGSDDIGAASWSEHIECRTVDDCDITRKGLVHYPIDTSEGQDGAPVWFYNPSLNQRTVVAIHAYDSDDPGGTCATSAGTFNCGLMFAETVAAAVFGLGGEFPVTPIFPPFAAEVPEPPAIMLVHGMGGDCQEGVDAGTFELLEFLTKDAMDQRKLSSASYPAEPRVDCFEYNSTWGMEVNAILLGAKLAMFRSELGLAPTHKIILVAHSFGGLVSRYYIERLGGDQFVSKLLMLGTPNKGVELLELVEPLCEAILGSLNPILQLLCTPGLYLFDAAIADMVPSRVHDALNSGFSPPSTNYHVIIGGAGNAHELLNPVFGIPNDCIVSSHSAEGPGFATFRNSEVVHANIPAAGCNHGRLHYFNDFETVQLVLSDIFEGADPVFGAATAEITAVEPDPAADPFARISTLILDSVGPGAMNADAVEVDAGSAGAAFALFWLGTETVAPTLQLTAEDPTGATLTDATPGVEHGTSTAPGFGDLMFEMYSVDAPAPGSWTLRVEGPDVPSEGHPYVLMTLLPETTTTFTAELDHGSYFVGQNMVLTASLREDGTPIPDAAASALVNLPDASQNVLPLHDDGLSGDVVAGDGVLSATLVASNCGFYMFEVSGSGTASGGAITRQHLVHATAQEPGDAVNDPCNPDEDGDGVHDIDEPRCGADPLETSAVPERVDGAFAGVDDDGDTEIDEALPPGSEAFDCDGDGFIGSAEEHVFGGLTDRDQDPCGMDAWAADFVTGGVPDSTNRITINDLASFVAPVMRAFTSPGDAGFDVRWDIIPGPGAVSQHININDLAALVAGSTSTPPMLGGASVFNGPECPWPP
jgi:pimeloyl-ACP methyl ester carboxylesterase